MMQGRVMTFLHFAETLGLTSALACEKIDLLLMDNYMYDFCL